MYNGADKMHKLQDKLTSMTLYHWYHHELFSIQWWLLVLLTILPWVVWWVLVDKTRIKQIWLYGALLTILIMQLDEIGTILHLWEYPYQLISIFPRLSPIDLSVLPVLHMIVYQYFGKWKYFLIANIITALIYSYLAEPFFVKIKIYHLISWRYTYSLPFYFIKAVLIKFLIEIVLNRKHS